MSWKQILGPFLFEVLYRYPLPQVVRVILTCSGNRVNPSFRKQNQDPLLARSYRQK